MFSVLSGCSRPAHEGSGPPTPCSPCSPSCPPSTYFILLHPYTLLHFQHSITTSLLIHFFKSINIVFFLYVLPFHYFTPSSPLKIPTQQTPICLLFHQRPAKSESGNTHIIASRLKYIWMADRNEEIRDQLFCSLFFSKFFVKRKSTLITFPTSKFLNNIYFRHYSK